MLAWIGRCSVTTPLHLNLPHSPSLPTTVHPFKIEPDSNLLQRTKTMSSEARQIANAANAQLSTGPRTEEGKARSSQNARTHGLTSSQLFNPTEERVESDKLRDELLADNRPQGALQETLFEQVIAA